MRFSIYFVCFFLTLISVGCQQLEVAGAYETRVPFNGHDPRFQGQEYLWRLELNQDSTFSFITELPMALYFNGPPNEVVTKGSSLVKGTWSLEKDAVPLKRESGETALGSTNTMYFPFDNNCLRISIIEGKLVIEGKEKNLELIKAQK
jgi:hypothetical protein